MIEKVAEVVRALRSGASGGGEEEGMAVEMRREWRL